MAGLGDFTDDSEVLHVMNVEYEEQFDETITHLFCRTRSGDARWVEVEGHKPSFFIHKDDASARIKNHDWVERVESGYEGIHGEPLARVYTRKPWHVGGKQGKKGLREYFEQTWEADVFYTSRFLIDTGIKTHVSIDKSETWTGQYMDGDYRVNVDDIESADVDWRADPRMVTIDIEVLSPDGFPSADEANHPVTAITAHDNYADAYTVWVLRYEGWTHSDTEIQNLAVENRPDDADVEDVHVFANEAEMLDHFNTYVEARRPDPLSGWNSSTTDNGKPFDYPYLINRCKGKNVMSYRDWSPMGQVWDGNWGPAGKGVEFFDMLKAYKKTQWQKPKGGYSLENISEKELGVGEEKLEIEDIDSAWRDEPGEFLKYNIRDVQATVGINDEAGVMSLFQNIRSLAGTQFDNCHNNIDLLDVYILREAKERGYRLPTNEAPERGWYYGAKVFDSKPGRHRNVPYFDVSSLYPNVMYQTNMSPETIVGTEEDLEESKYTESDCCWSYIDTRSTNVKKDSDPEYERCYFLKPSVKEGFIRSVIDKLLELKDHYNESELYDAVKRIVNCFSGDTEVVTADGIENIRDLEVGDMVYSFNEEGGSVELKPVTETFHYPNYDDELVTMSNSRVDFEVTPNHTMVVKRSRHSDEYERVDAGDLNEWTNYELPHDWSFEHGDGIGTIDLAEHTTIDYEVDGNEIREAREKCSWNERYIDGDTFIKLAAWYVTEGSIYTSKRKEYDNTTRGVTTTIHIANENTTLRDNIRGTLDDIGCSYYEDARGFTITGHGVLADVLETLFGGSSAEKCLDSIIFDASKQQKRQFFETLMDGDGDSRANEGGGNRYTTLSDELRDDVCRLVTELGYNPHYSCDSGVWRIRFTDGKNTFRMHRDGGTAEADGVYCVEVADNHTLLAGRNGNFQFVGQSVYGVMGDSNSYGKGFRLYDWRIAEAVTLQGRKIIIEGADYATDAIDGGYITNGDTDGVGVAMPKIDSQEDALDKAIEVSENMTEHLQDWCEETMSIENSTITMETEKLMDPLFIPEAKSGGTVKKRYCSLIVWED